MFSNNKCPICRNNAGIFPTSEHIEINCLKCGKYKYSKVLEKELPLSEREKTLFSGFLRDTPGFYITQSNLNELKNIIRMPSVSEKADRALLAFESLTEVPGDQLQFAEGDNEYLLISGESYIINPQEWRFIINDLLRNEAGYIKMIAANRYQITPQGWNYISEIKRINKDSYTVFIAMWFDKKVAKTRDSIKQAIINAGYTPIIIDEVDHNDDVTDKIISHINRARFVVADLTEQRGGVYYEAGYAKGLGIPVIFTVRENQLDPPKTDNNPDPKRVHFDINHYKIIKWSENKLPNFIEELKNRITATIGDGPFMSLDS
jgi:hypothetical protein